MKKTTLVFGLMLIAGGQSWGWEFSRNPDRFPSVGLKVESYSTSGEFTSMSAPNRPAVLVERGDAKDSYTGLGVNLRLPTTDSLTIDLDYMGIDGESTHNRNNNIYAETSNLDGYKMSLGVRLYFNH